MIWLTRLDGTPLLLNADHIVYVEGGAESIVVLTTSERIRVSEGPADILARLNEAKSREALSAWLAPESTD